MESGQSATQGMGGIQPPLNSAQMQQVDDQQAQQRNELNGNLDETVGYINNFDITGGYKAHIPLDALMLGILVSRTELLEDILRSKIEGIQEKNSKLQKANETIAQARSDQKHATNSHATLMSMSVREFIMENDISWGDDSGLKRDLKSPQWQLVTENLKGFSESLTSTTQLDMAQMQSGNGKYNQTFEMLTSFIAKNFRNKDSIINNWK